MVYLAEVIFYATSSPPDTIITVPPPLNVFATTSDGTTGTATSMTTTTSSNTCTTATTGQVSPLGQLSPSHDTYSHIQHDVGEGRGGALSHQGGSGEEGEYSTLSHGNSPHVLGGGGEDSASQLYAQVDKN